jgi:flagella basal body P-ring formation protein FlgA
LKQAQSARVPLTAEMVTLGEVDAALIGGEILQDTQQLSDQRLRRDMAAGAALRRSDIEIKPPVTAGTNVDVFAQVGRIVVQTRAVAERDGFVGQSISARLPNTQEQLMIEVIGEDRAIVSNNIR